jgi:uncharacterized protein DUF1932/F420-dependent NADP oxidoreductase-like protein
VTIGVLHPGEMGAAIAGALRAGGATVLWASHGRSAATAARAGEAGLDDAGTLDELARRSDVIVSLCPPAAALEVATTLQRFDGLYVDANAIAPATARTIAGVVKRYVDGGVVGPPPHEPGTTRLYLSGSDAPSIAELFAGTVVDARVVSERIGDASALKMTYAAWTKGTAALLLAVRAAARAEGVEEALLAEWALSLPDLPDRSAAAARSALAKGWRWIGEMEEIAASFEAAGLPGGFHLAAADLYRSLGNFKDGAAPPALAEVTAALMRGARRKSASGRSRRRSAPSQQPSGARFKFGTAALKRAEAKRGGRERQESIGAKFKFGKQVA